MFQIHKPIHVLDAHARRKVYSEFVRAHDDLTSVSVGCHNDMIMLEVVPGTEEAVAVLLAKGRPGDYVVFPQHRHSKGEATICLDGHYGESLAVGENLDDLFEGDMTLARFQSLYPGVVEVLPERDGRIPIKLGIGACWSLGDDTEHKPFGWIGENGVLLGQIYWGGPNQITEPK